MTRSRSFSPQLLFSVENHDNFLFLSAPQPQNPDLNSSSQVVCANRLMHFPFNDSSCRIIGPVHGLICLRDKRFSKGLRKETLPMICNPSTGQSLVLPKVKTRRVGVMSYLGYDPIAQQFKVLSMSWTSSAGHRLFDEYQILTIGGSGKNMSWRMIECCIPPHYSYDKGICIDGVLYYRARVDSFSEASMLVCFDVRSEKFRFIALESKGLLVNYNGKLGSLCNRSVYVHGTNGGRNGIIMIDLWVLEDAENKQEWSKRTYVLPTMWQEIQKTTYLHILGITRTNEIVISPAECTLSCVFFYNIERDTIVKVGIQGMEAFGGTRVDLYLDHIEDVKLM